MEQSPFWEANSRLSCSRKSLPFVEPEGSLPCSEEPATASYSECVIIHGNTPDSGKKTNVTYFKVLYGISLKTLRKSTEASVKEYTVTRLSRERSTSWVNLLCFITWMTHKAYCTTTHELAYYGDQLLCLTVSVRYFRRQTNNFKCSFFLLFYAFSTMLDEPQYLLSHSVNSL
jgi:hypothetical protein